GGELKPSLDLVVTAPLVDAREEVAGPPVMEEPRIRVGGAGTPGARGRRRQGDAAAGGDEQAAAGPAGGSADAGTAGDAGETAREEAGETVRSGTESRPGRTVRLRIKR